MISLRPYQREALDAIYEFFHENDGNPVVSLPTGTGKSLIVAKMLKESFEWWPDTRVLILTHVKELIQQDFMELLRLWPEAPAGIHSAGLNRRDVWSPIIFGGIQTLHNKAHELPRTDLVLIDEAHLVPRKSSTMYRKFLINLGKLNPHMKVVGLTATPFRLDSGMLTEGEDALFTDLVYEANVKDLVEAGFLAPPIGVANEASIDTTGVGIRGGEFIPGQLEAAALDPDTCDRIAAEIIRAGEDRQGWLIFACGIKHAKMLQEAIKRHGTTCEAAFGDTPSAERSRIIEAFKRRDIRALATVGILTTGFNARHVDLIACARPTKSTGLWIQMVGRGLRLSPETGKENCVAEGSMILTDQGLVPIEKITKEIRIWDGDCLSPHDGIIFRGEREVITYAGLTATPDHLVWTKKGWQAFGKCAIEQIPIAVTGIGRSTVRQIDGYFSRSSETRTQSICFGALQYLR